MKRIALTSVITLSLGLTAAAVNADIVIEFEPPEALTEAIAQHEDHGRFSGVSYYDVSGDGMVEGLVTYGNCTGPGGCDWRLFADMGDAYGVFAEGNGRDVFLEPTSPAGALLNLDGVTYAMGDEGTYIYGHLLQGLRPDPVAQGDYELVTKNTGYTNTARMDLQKFMVDIFGDAALETVYIIGGSEYALGNWGSPYAIFDAAGALVMDGISADGPLIFKSPMINGTTVANVKPSGIEIIRLQ